MIGYTTVGTRDLAKASAFFDTVLAPLGGQGNTFGERMRFYGGGGGASLAVCTPWDGQPATVGNGMMVGLAAPSVEAVDKVHALALSSGGSDEGAPGERMPGIYGAYFRDLDGNKFAIIHRG